MTKGLPKAARAVIRRLRRDRGWTLADLSRRSGGPPSSLSRMELGHTTLGYEVLLRVCRALDVEIDHLIRTEPPGPLPAQTSRRAVIRAGDGEFLDLAGMTGVAGATEVLCQNFTPRR